MSYQTCDQIRSMRAWNGQTWAKTVLSYVLYNVCKCLLTTILAHIVLLITHLVFLLYFYTASLQLVLLHRHSCISSACTFNIAWLPSCYPTWHLGTLGLWIVSGSLPGNSLTVHQLSYQSQSQVSCCVVDFAVGFLKGPSLFSVL